MNRELLTQLFLRHKGKIIGMGMGLIVGIMVLTIGFWKTIFLMLSVSIGYWAGGISDKKEKFFALLDKMLPRGLN